MNWLNKLERKIGKFYIPNLMIIITVGTAMAFGLAQLVNSEFINLIYLSPSKVLSGEVWRLITFIFVPTNNSAIWLFFILYFYYMAGSSLERVWGGFKFNVYYLVGMLATILVSFITNSPVTGTFVNLSLFLAYAKIYPDMELLIFFILPVKVKYLGYLNWAIIIFLSCMNLFKGNFSGAILTLVPIVNYLLFFARSNYKQTKMKTGSVIRIKDYKKKIKKTQKDYIHKCEICGITNKDDPNMEFRYCSKCSGKHCYCEKHIFEHIHLK